MAAIVYEVVEHDGVGPTGAWTSSPSGSTPMRRLAKRPTKLLPATNFRARMRSTYQDAEGRDLVEIAAGDDRPKTTVEDEA